MNVLLICANPKPAEESVSKELSIAFISKLIEQNPDVEINNVDLYQDPPPFVDYRTFRAVWTRAFDPTYKPTKAEQASTEYATRHAELFNAADLLVLTMPMWHCSMPAIMKAWIEQVLAPGMTFRFELGPDGLQTIPLHKIRKIVLLVSSGDAYAEDDPRDALTPAVRAIFESVGIGDVSIAWADGQTAVKYGDHEERKETALDAAAEAAEDVVEELGEPA